MVNVAPVLPEEEGLRLAVVGGNRGRTTCAQQVLVNPAGDSRPHERVVSRTSAPTSNKATVSAPEGASEELGGKGTFETSSINRLDSVVRFGRFPEEWRDLKLWPESSTSK